MEQTLKQFIEQEEEQTNKDKSLKIGKLYTVRTAIDTTATPLYRISQNKYLFVSDSFYATPFIIWDAQLSTTCPDCNSIDAYSGKYFKNLSDALRTFYKVPKTEEDCESCKYSDDCSGLRYCQLCDEYFCENDNDGRCPICDGRDPRNIKSSE